MQESLADAHEDQKRLRSECTRLSETVLSYEGTPKQQEQLAQLKTKVRAADCGRLPAHGRPIIAPAADRLSCCGCWRLQLEETQTALETSTRQRDEARVELRITEAKATTSLQAQVSAETAVAPLHRELQETKSMLEAVEKQLADAQEQVGGRGRAGRGWGADMGGRLGGWHGLHCSTYERA